MPERLGLEGEFQESELPLLIQRSGMAEWNDGVVRILDRRRLPHAVHYVNCATPDDVAVAIEDMVIQGAFSISIAAGYGLALTPKHSNAREAYRASAERLLRTRPTGLALKRMIDACLERIDRALSTGADPVAEVLTLVDRGAAALAKQGYKTGQRAAALLDDGAAILTHCFPDRSYCYLLMEAKRHGKALTVYCSETRPYLQGARLTAYCAHAAGFETKVATDGMGGHLIRSGVIDAFVTAADRVCMDGAVCNKIGTYPHALAAHANGVPYYVLRQSGPDTESASEADVHIESRDGEDVVTFGDWRTAPEGVSGVYPAFDITPPHLVTSIVTDRGVFASDRIAEYVNATPFLRDAVV